MSEPPLRPSGPPDAEAGREAPHLADYWQVVSRRIWLVILIFGVTALSSIWAVSRQTIFHQSFLSIQVNDPLERTRSLVQPTRASGGNIFVDPIQSEMEVLRSGAIAGEVVDALGLRLVPSDPGLGARELFRDARVARDAAEGEYRIAYVGGGEVVELRDGDGAVLGSATVGSVLDAGAVRFVPNPSPTGAPQYGLRILPREEVVRAVRGNVAAAPRTNTNIIDVSYLAEDPELAPAILNGLAEALRDFGARRVIAAASREVQFIEDRLDSARVQLGESLEAIRRFKETEAFTNLSGEEQRLVNQSQELGGRIEALERERSVLAATTRKIESEGGLSETDLVTLTAELSGGSHAQIRELISRLQTRQEALRALLGSGITADHPEARAARARVRELENELLEAIRANLLAVEGRLEPLNRQQSGLLARQREFPELENRLQTLQVRQVTDMGTYEFLLAQLQQARITEAAAAPYVEIIDPALGSTPVQPRGRINVLLGSLLGLILGVGAAFFLEYLDRTVRTSSDVETLLGLPVIGVVPRMRRVADGEEAAGSRGGRNLPLVVALDPLDPAAEAYRNLRMNLMFMSTEDRPVRSVLVSSPGPDEGKSTTAVNLAVMLAQQGEKVLLLDADLRRPALHRTLDVVREPGLSNVLVGEVELREALRPNVLPNLDFLPAGSFPPNPSELLTSKAMAGLLETFEGRYAHVVLDAPPVLAVTDAALLSARSDGVVLVLRSAGTEERAAERAVEQLGRIGVTIFGVVLNEVASRTTEESYYLQYHHSYHPDEVSKWGKLKEAIDSRLEKVRSRT